MCVWGGGGGGVERISVTCEEQVEVWVGEGCV